MVGEGCVYLFIFYGNGRGGEGAHVYLKKDMSYGMKKEKKNK